MLVTPFPITTFLIWSRLVNHGVSFAHGYSSIAPSPAILSVPAPSSVHVRCSPQVPESTMVLSAAAENVSRQHSAARSDRRTIRFFIAISPIFLGHCPHYTAFLRENKAFFGKKRAKKPPERAAFVRVFGFARGLTDPGRRPASWRRRRGWRCRWAGTPRRSCRRRCRPSAGYRPTRRRRTRSGHCRGRRELRRRT